LSTPSTKAPSGGANGVLSSDDLLEHPDIQHAFQTDRRFHQIHVTSSKAERALHHVSAALEWANALSRKCGLPGPDRIVASSSKRKFVLLTSGPDAAQSEMVNTQLVGLITKPDASAETLSRYVKSLR